MPNCHSARQPEERGAPQNGGQKHHQGESTMAKRTGGSDAVTRRRALGQGLAATLGGTLLSGAALGAPPPQPIVKTTAGEVKGRQMRRVYVFKGIPYGASTAGAGR